jgi:hypothetical protein
MEKALAQPQKRWPQLWPIMVGKWSLDQEMLTQGKRLLTAMIEHMPQQSEAIGWFIGLFLKLLATDQTTLALAPLLLSTIGNVTKITLELSSPLLAESLVDVPLTRLSKLTKYTSYTDDGVRQGALALWSRLVGSILDERSLLLMPLNGTNSDPCALTGGLDYHSLAMRMLQKRGRVLLY